jgi:hypothetical protein
MVRSEWVETAFRPDAESTAGRASESHRVQVFSTGGTGPKLGNAAGFRKHLQAAMRFSEAAKPRDHPVFVRSAATKDALGVTLLPG